MDAPKGRNLHHWGWSEYLYCTDSAALAYAEGKTGGASSLHYHAHKHNTFLVLSGLVEIEVAPGHGAPDFVYVLRAGESCNMVAGQHHRMVFAADSTLLELYAALPGQKIDLGDITRLDAGRSP